MQTPQHTFTAKEVSVALECTKRAVLADLNGVAATSTKTVRGQDTRAWDFSALPTLLRTKIEHAASRDNFTDFVAWLNHRVETAIPTRDTRDPAPPPNRDLHGDLAHAIEALGCADLQHLAPWDREYLWSEICPHFEALAASTPASERRQLKASLFAWLVKNIPGLAHTPASLRRTFDRKLAGGPETWTDKRAKCSGNFRDILCSACLQKAVELDAALNGNESQAWRRLKLEGRLCPECAERHQFDVRRAKSYMPHSIRARLSPIVEQALPWVKSAAAGRMAGPYVVGEVDTAPADFLWGDDVTWNHKVWTTDADGLPYLCRPDCVYLGDDLTGYPVHFDLIAGDPGQPAHYNSTHIRRLMLEAHDLLGLPHRGYIFENGVWRSSVVRDESLKAECLPWAETELGLKSMNVFVETRHTLARNPRSKPEGDFRILQERMRLEPGFVGFNQRAEQSDRSKRLERDFAQRVKQGKEHPGNEYLSLSQWGKRIGDILGEFANEPQNGKRCPGRSPAEMWQEALNLRPLRKLPDEARWILATHRQLVPVGAKGIILKGQCYANERLARYIGRNLWAFYNIECPELLTVCDLKRTEYLTLKGNSAPRRTARETSEGRAALSESQRNIAGFNRMARVIAGTVPHTIQAYRVDDKDAGPAERELGQHIAQARAAHLETNRRHANAGKLRRNQALQLAQEARTESSSQPATL